MDTATSKLKTQFPLSEKKFTKKFISRNLGGAILFIVLIAFTLFIQSVSNGIDNESSSLLRLLVEGCIVFFILRIIFEFWYIKAYIKTYFYEGEPNYLTIRKGVFTSTEIHVPYLKIQDVYVDQDFLDRLMGLYDVHIASATVSSGIEAHIDGVDKGVAEGLKHYLLNRLQGGSESSQTAATPDQKQEAATPTRVTLSLSKKISSDEYPIIDAWWIGSIGKAIGSSLISIIAMTYIFIKTDSSQMIGFLIYFAIFGLTFIWQIIKLALFKKNYRFEFTPEYLYLRNGIFSMSETHMPYNTIQDVRVEQSFLDRIFGVYTVAIENAVGGTGKAVGLLGLSKQSAEEISTILKNDVLGLHNQNKV